jgi:hypothetical protein
MEDGAMTESHRTTDHDEIRHWVEQRNGRPARVAGTGEGDDAGLLRIDFTEENDDDSLEEVSWDEFFEKFEEKKLAFLYQDRKADGEPSTFNKLVRR